MRELPVAEFPEAWEARLEAALEVVAQILDRQLVEMRRRRAATHGPELVQKRAHRRGVLLGGFEIEVVDVEIREIAVGEDAHEIGLGEQPQAHRMVGRALRAECREAGHQPGRFLVARRVDLTQEVERAAGEISDQAPAVLLLPRVDTEARDQIGLAGLAWAEDADAHPPRRRRRQLRRFVLDTPGEVDQRPFLAGDPAGGRRNLAHPGARQPGRVGQIARGGGQRLGRGARSLSTNATHLRRHRRRSTPVSSQ